MFKTIWMKHSMNEHWYDRNGSPFFFSNCNNLSLTFAPSSIDKLYFKGKIAFLMLTNGRKMKQIDDFKAISGLRPSFLELTVVCRRHRLFWFIVSFSFWVVWWVKATLPKDNEVGKLWHGYKWTVVGICKRTDGPVFFGTRNSLFCGFLFGFSWSAWQDAKQMKWTFSLGSLSFVSAARYSETHDWTPKTNGDQQQQQRVYFNVSSTRSWKNGDMLECITCRAGLKGQSDAHSEGYRISRVCPCRDVLPATRWGGGNQWECL